MPTGSIVPWIDATPTPVPSPVPVIIPLGTTPCAPSELTATAGWMGGGGQMLGWLGVTNVGQRPCVVDGSPRLVQLRAGTTTLKSVIYHAGKDAGPGNETGVAGPVLLQPGDQAAAYLWWTNWCERVPVVTAVLVTLPAGGSPVVAGPTSPGPGLGGTPRCDYPTAGSTFTAYSFVPVASQEPVVEPQAASVSLTAPATTVTGADLAFLVTLTNRGTAPALLSPCPIYTEDFIVSGKALKPPAPQQFLLNCAAIGPALAPGATVTLQMHYAVPAGLPSGPVDLVWGMGPGGPFDAGTAIGRASLSIVRP